MQNDLISKQSVIEKMWELYNSYGNDAEVYDELTTEAINREFSRLQRAIEGMETAYDVEKVVAELEEQRKIEEKVSKECLVEFKNMHIYARNCFGVAITKVRNGGKE